MESFHLYNGLGREKGQIHGNNLPSGDFVNKAPAALVQKEREKLAAYKETAEKIKAQLT